MNEVFSLHEKKGQLTRFPLLILMTRYVASLVHTNPPLPLTSETCCAQLMCASGKHLISTVESLDDVQDD